MTTVTINGNSYTFSDDFDNYGFRTAFPALVNDILAESQNVANNAAIAQSAGGLNYKFDDGTASANPGDGKLRFNNATLASATEMYISETTDDAQDVSSFLAYWDDGTSTVRGTLKITKQTQLSTYAIFSISGTLTDSGDWDIFSVSYIAGNGTLSGDDELTLTFVPKGEKGDTGAGVGDGDYGDITVSGSGSSWVIDSSAISTAKVAANAITKAKLAADARRSWHTVVIEEAADGDYKLSDYMPFAGKILTVQSVSTGHTGGTATVKIGSTALGGTANTIGTSVDEEAHSSSNSFSKGNDVNVTFASLAGSGIITFNIEVEQN